MTKKKTMNRMAVASVVGLLLLALSAMAGDGGIIEKKQAIPSKPISVENAQNALPPEVVSNMVKEARKWSRLPLVMGAKKAPIVLRLVERDDKSTIALYPEEFLATINVRAVGVGCTARTSVVERVEKEIIRAGYYLMGSGYGQKECLTSSIRSVKELDRLDIGFVSAESQIHIRGGQQNGVKLVQWITYRQACRQGIAPHPVTEDEKRVWDEVHAMPTKPIQIKPEPKKVSE